MHGASQLICIGRDGAVVAALALHEAGVVIDYGRLELKQHAIKEMAQLQSVSMPKASSASTSCLLPVSGGGGCDGCAVGAGHVDRLGVGVVRYSTCRACRRRFTAAARLTGS